MIERERAALRPVVTVVSNCILLFYNWRDSAVYASRALHTTCCGRRGKGIRIGLLDLLSQTSSTKCTHLGKSGVLRSGLRCSGAQCSSVRGNEVYGVEDKLWWSELKH